MRTPQQVRAEEDERQSDWWTPLLNRLEDFMSSTLLTSEGFEGVWEACTSKIEEDRAAFVISRLRLFGWNSSFRVHGADSRSPSLMLRVWPRTEGGKS